MIQDPPPAHLLASPPNHTQTDDTYDQFTPSRSSSHTYTSSLCAFPHSTTPTTLPELLKFISEVLPQTFFKPLFSLATSSSSKFSSGEHDSEAIGGIGPGTIALANTLCVVHVLGAIVQDWWLRDAEMICIALLGDVSSDSGDKRGDEDKDKTRGRVGLGQMIVLLELVNKLRMVRRLRDSTVTSGGRRGSVDAIAVILVSVGVIRIGVLVIDGDDGDTNDGTCF